MRIYADSSFFVSIYLEDSHTKAAIQRLARRPDIWLTPFHAAEFANAVAQQIFRRSLSQEAGEGAHRNFEIDRDAGLWRSAAFPEGTFRVAASLARTHVIRLGTRTLDSLHVAAALELGAKQFWTFDERQAKLAKAAGLRIT